MTWVRSPNVIKAHDKAIVYIQSWWDKCFGRALIANVTGDPYGIDLYNDTEYVHINYRTGKGKWNNGPFPYLTLRELYHKLRKFKKLKEEKGKPVYIIHVSTDYSRCVISEIDSFELNNRNHVEMPSETHKRKRVKRWVCFSPVFEEYSLPTKNFGDGSFSIQSKLKEFSQGRVS